MSQKTQKFTGVADHACVFAIRLRPTGVQIQFETTGRPLVHALFIFRVHIDLAGIVATIQAIPRAADIFPFASSTIVHARVNQTHIQIIVLIQVNNPKQKIALTYLSISSSNTFSFLFSSFTEFKSPNSP